MSLFWLRPLRPWWWWRPCKAFAQTMINILIVVLWTLVNLLSTPPPALPSPPRQLLDLPQELLMDICEIFCWHCQGLTERHLDIFHGMCAQSTYFSAICVDKRRRGLDLAPVRLDGYSLEECWTTLSRISLSCGRLRSIAQPILHHSILVSRRRLPLLAQTLMAKPDLASSIIELYIHEEKDTDFSNAGTSEKANLAAMLIKAAVNLQRLHLGCEEPAFFSALFRSISSWPLPKSGEERPLEYISLDPEIKHWMPWSRLGRDQGRMIDGNEASHLLRLAGSSLRTLRCRSLTPPMLKPGLNLKNIVELSLCQNWAEETRLPVPVTPCTLTRPRLRNLLEAVGPGLQRFSISRHITNLARHAVHADRRLVELQDVLEELLRWKDTLRELVFEGDLATFRRDGEIILRSGVGQLAQFRNLEVLAIRGREYFDNKIKRQDSEQGATTVPVNDFIAALSPRLRHLRISGFEWRAVLDVLSAISRDVDQIPGPGNNRQFPCLRIVQVDAGLERFWNCQARHQAGPDRAVLPMWILGEISRLGRGLSRSGIAFDRWEDPGWRDEWLGVISGM